MTMQEIREQIMFQTNNDADDLEDFLPHVDDYINEGYERLARVWDNIEGSTAQYPRLKDDADEPNLPEWTHRAIADWATWLVYRNGNPQKQSRGMAFRSAFEDVLSRIADEGGAAGLNEDGSRKRYKYFRNIPV